MAGGILIKAFIATAVPGRKRAGRMRALSIPSPAPPPNWRVKYRSTQGEDLQHVMCRDFRQPQARAAISSVCLTAILRPFAGSKWQSRSALLAYCVGLPGHSAQDCTCSKIRALQPSTTLQIESSNYQHQGSRSPDLELLRDGALSSLLRVSHLRSSSSPNMPAANGMTKTQTSAASGAVPSREFPHGV